MLKTLEIAVSDRGRLPRMLSHDSGSPCQSFPEDFPAGREISGPISHVGKAAWHMAMPSRKVAKHILDTKNEIWCAIFLSVSGMPIQAGRSCDFCRNCPNEKGFASVRADRDLRRKSSEYVQCGEIS